MIDYEELAVRALDQPVGHEARAALRVWADALEAAGDPRGPLIALEHALRAQPERRLELRRAMDEHALANAAALLGPLEELLRFRRALALDWRSGMLHGAALDTRYLAVRARREPVALVTQLVTAPAAVRLRRLHVRVPREAEVAAVIRALSKIAAAPLLEEIAVVVGVRATGMSRATGVGPPATLLLERYADLRLLIMGEVAVLPPASGRVARALEAASPATAEGRATLGRALVSRDPALRAAALERLAALGEAAFAFVETLMVLLAPGIVTPQAPIAACLGGLGEHARIALPLLSTITGRTAHYDRETRSAAGAAIAALRG